MVHHKTVRATQLLFYELGWCGRFI